MATSIEWTRGDDGRPGETWNPVTGCTKVSQGCKHCYAERIFPRPYPGRAFTDIRLHHDRLGAPDRWKKPRRIFVNSLSDLFHEQVPDRFLGSIWRVMCTYELHTFIVLTKRAERMASWLNRCAEGAGMGWITHDGAEPEAYGGTGHIVGEVGQWPLPNVWLGVSVENQETADERIPMLAQTPAAVRFLSVEPLLQHVILDLNGIDWVIVGGESGPHARPCDVDWIRSVVLQCQAAQVPVFVKQLGARPCEEGGEPGHVWIGDGPKVLRKIVDRKGADVREWPDDLCVQEFPEC